MFVFAVLRLRAFYLHQYSATSDWTDESIFCPWVFVFYLAYFRRVQTAERLMDILYPSITSCVGYWALFPDKAVCGPKLVDASQE